VTVAVADQLGKNPSVLGLPTALLNSAMAIGRQAAGAAPESALPFALLGWGIIAYLHRQRRWPPFAARGPAG
jgi:hypothetical protein